MRVCIVGSGPSAEGKGAEIDACDFVVRIKAYWEESAASAGERIDAWAIFGKIGYPAELPQPKECWITHTLSMFAAGPAHETRCEDLINCLPRCRVRWVRHAQRLALERCLGGCSPSTGLLAIQMAIQELRPTRLLLYGFDATRPGLPTFTHARHVPGRRGFLPEHKFAREKRLIARLGAAEWLGAPCKTKLEWPDMPEECKGRRLCASV